MPARAKAGGRAPLPTSSPPPASASWEWDPASGAAVFSPEWPAMLGLEASQPPGPTIDWWWDRLSESDRAWLRACCLRCLEEKTPFSAVVLTRAEAGELRLLVRGQAATPAPGNPPVISGSVHSALATRPSERDDIGPCRSLLDHAPDLILRLDRDYLPTYFNWEVGRYLPRAVECGDSGNYRELGIHLSRQEFYRRNVRLVFDTGRIVRDTMTTVTQIGVGSGEYCFWPEFAPDGTVKSVFCLVVNRTEQVRAEEAKRLNDERLTALNRLTHMQDDSEEEIIEFVLDQMVLLTKSTYSCLFFPEEEGGGKLHLSKALRALPGVETWPMDRMPHQFLPGKNDIDHEIFRLQVGNYRGEDNCYVHYGDRRVRRFVILPSKENGKTVCVASVGNKDTDYDDDDVRQLELFLNGVWLVLRRKRYLKTLEKAKEDAEAANRAKDAFLANVSHELRTPLNGMLGMLQLLHGTVLTEQQSRFVDAADLSGRALLRILSDILDFSRMESGKMALQQAPFNLRDTLLPAMNLFAEEARRKGLAMRVDIDPALPETLVGDDARVRQIVFNLVGNALKFTEKGGVGLECRLLPHTVNGGHLVYLAVSDTGIGIPEHAHNAVFEAFAQLNDPRVRTQSGTGLGLGIVKRLIQIMGGSLTLESAPGEGTIVHCSIPFGAVPPERAREARPRPKRAAGAPKRLDILVAEDDAISRIVVQNFLQSAGHRAVCVDSGKKALEALRLHAFDCLLTDIRMPEMDGLETVRRIRAGEYADIRPGRAVRAAVREVVPEAFSAGSKSLRDIPRDLTVAALTAHAMAGDRESFLAGGMDLYLSKPLMEEELAELTEHIAMRSSSTA